MHEDLVFVVSLTDLNIMLHAMTWKCDTDFHKNLVLLMKNTKLN